MQGGNISHIYGNEQIYSYSMFEQGEFADESFKIKHNKPGLLGMCHRNNVKNSNECQFYITL